MLTHDKGYARKLTEFGKIVNPLGIRTVGEFPNLTEALLGHGFSSSQVRKIMGENWVRVLGDVWDTEDAWAIESAPVDESGSLTTTSNVA